MHVWFRGIASTAAGIVLIMAVQALGVLRVQRWRAGFTGA